VEYLQSARHNQSHHGLLIMRDLVAIHGSNDHPSHQSNPLISIIISTD
jgi:hypothetical protein